MDEQVSQFLIVLNDEAKLKACAERYRKGSGVQPSRWCCHSPFYVVQSVVREATVFLMSVKKTESDLPGTFAPYLESMSALLAEGHCHIWDLFSFMEVEQIVGNNICFHVDLFPFVTSLVLQANWTLTQ